MSTFKKVLPLGLLVLLLTACDVVRTSPGQSITIEKNIDFYLASGENQYRTIPEGLPDLFISDVTWYASDGITVKDPVLTTHPTLVTWEAGDKKFSVPGVGISIQAEIILDETISVGKKGVYVELPNIKLLSNAMGVQPKTGQFALPDRTLIGQVNVHSSNTAAIAAKWITGR